MDATATTWRPAGQRLSSSERWAVPSRRRSGFGHDGLDVQFPVRWICALPLCFLFGVSPAASQQGERVDAMLLAQAKSWPQFLGSATAQRSRWLDNDAQAGAPEPLVRRLQRVNQGLAFFVVAEDWCPDSVNTVPYIVHLASAAGVAVSVLDRTLGRTLMDRHRTPDGRAVTPTVVLLRNGRDVGAWVERPAVLQQMFRAMATNPALRDQFEQRQAWYDADRGRSTMAEIVALAEATASRR